MRGAVQMLLDLFDAPVQATEPVPSATARPVPGSAVPVPLHSVLAPAVFRHPLANRQALLGTSVVAYQFRRARRRTIGFLVGPDGLVVSAPRWVPLGEVDAALREKANWILRKLQESEERRQRLESARVTWADGAELLYLGQPLRVRLDGAVGRRHAEWVPAQPEQPATLRLSLPHTADAAQIRDATQAWLMRQARALFTERLDHFAPALGVRWSRLYLSNAGTRWGSARADGAIRLNWRLIHLRLPVIDYVVAHELSHLRVMDHSPRFWDTVGTVVPDYVAWRDELRDQPVPHW